MGILSTGYSFLQSTLTTSVTARLENGDTEDWDGYWSGNTFDTSGAVLSGSERTDADAVFHVKQSDFPNGIDRRIRIERDGQSYKIMHAEKIFDAQYRLHLKREMTRRQAPR